MLRPVILAAALALVACSSPPPPMPDIPPDTPPATADKDYERPLAPGQNALRKLAPGEWPNLQAACRALAQGGFDAAASKSAAWFEKPSAAGFFPVSGIDHARAKQSLAELRRILVGTSDPARIEAELRAKFDCYISVGCDDVGTVLFTGYFSPVFRASKQRRSDLAHALYRPPADLKKDPRTGDPIGGYASRKELEGGRLKDTDALVWLPTQLDAYIAGVNGSAKLDLAEGGTMYVGYAAHNGHQYVSIRRELVKDGKIGKRDGLPAIRAYFKAHPDQIAATLAKNPRYVFFQEYDGGDWPSGSLGVQVTAYRSLATDKAIFPRAGVVLVETELPGALPSGPGRPYSQWMLDQDTGGAIRAPGRADIYLGVGDSAESLAGRQAAEGKLYYFFLKAGA